MNRELFGKEMNKAKCRKAEKSCRVKYRAERMVVRKGTVRRLGKSILSFCIIDK